MNVSALLVVYWMLGTSRREIATGIEVQKDCVTIGTGDCFVGKPRRLPGCSLDPWKSLDPTCQIRHQWPRVRGQGASLRQSCRNAARRILCLAGTCCGPKLVAKQCPIPPCSIDSPLEATKKALLQLLRWNHDQGPRP